MIMSEAMLSKLKKATPDNGKDKLYHLFCAVCLQADEKAGKTPTPYCGATRKDGWHMSKPSEEQHRLQCIVCASLFKEPCERCGVRTERTL